MMPEMSSDDNHRQAHVTPTARKFVAFSPPPLLILALQTILFHIIVAEGHYMLCSIEEYFFKKKVEQSCLTMM